MSKVKCNQIALFKASKTFNIVGIGQILTGEIIEGNLSPGNLMQFEINGTLVDFTIDAVESVEYVSKGESEVGLIFDITSPELQISLNAILGQNVFIFSR